MVKLMFPRLNHFSAEVLLPVLVFDDALSGEDLGHGGHPLVLSLHHPGAQLFNLVGDAFVDRASGSVETMAKVNYPAKKYQIKNLKTLL